jgi:hypothetical protein
MPNQVCWLEKELRIVPLPPQRRERFLCQVLRITDIGGQKVSLNVKPI